MVSHSLTSPYAFTTIIPGSADEVDEDVNREASSGNWELVEPYWTAGPGKV
jgi:hypothetical protein